MLWAARFRLDGPGLALAGGGVPTWLTGTAVREHARTWFVRGNAAAVWHGERPEGLRLPLPAGHREVAVLVDAPAEGVPAWRSVTPGQVAAALRSRRPSALLARPEKADPGPLPGGIERTHLCNNVPVLPKGRRSARRSWRGR